VLSDQKKLRPRDAAAYLGLSASTLAKMRLRGDGPLYAKLGSRVVAYDTSDLDRWVNERKLRSTSELKSKQVGREKHT
jgi:predicted DNA-binding transcriptional regulator AlpA